MNNPIGCACKQRRFGSYLSSLLHLCRYSFYRIATRASKIFTKTVFASLRCSLFPTKKQGAVCRFLFAVDSAVKGDPKQYLSANITQLRGCFRLFQCKYTGFILISANFCFILCKLIVRAWFRTVLDSPQLSALTLPNPREYGYQYWQDAEETDPLMGFLRQRIVCRS